MKYLLVVAAILLMAGSVAIASSDGNATDEEILAYAQGVIDAGYGSNAAIPHINNQTLWVDVYLSSYDDLGDIGYAAWTLGIVTDKVCLEYSNRFNQTVVSLHNKRGDRHFGYIVLNRMT